MTDVKIQRVDERHSQPHYAPMREYRGFSKYVALASLVVGFHSAEGLELQGITTRQCKTTIGVPIDVDDSIVTLMTVDGNSEKVIRTDIESVAIFNVIENPFRVLKIDNVAQSRLKALYLDDSDKPVGLVFAVRFIEDLVLFMSIDGQSHVHSLKDIDRLRPAPDSARGIHQLTQFKATTFAIANGLSQCAESQPPASGATRPTRVLADKISIAELYSSFASGYEALESFQERTYLYAKPFLYPKSSRLGILLGGAREEPGISFPVYFQWSTGESYRFQSYTVLGGKPIEFLPNAESVFAVRSDVKSHIFHGLFVGNIMGMPAGESIFLEREIVKLNDSRTIDVQPSFNYLAMMGGDYGPFSLSVGFFYPTFGIKVGTQEREVLGSSLTYAVRGMVTTRHLRLRAIGSLTEYKRDNASTEDVLVRVAGAESTPPSSFDFRALFLRPGIDYDVSEELRLSADLILVDGSYKEVRSGLGSDIRFQRITTQFAVQQSFGDYITLIGYLDLLHHSYTANFAGETDKNKDVTDTKFFGALEFVF